MRKTNRFITSPVNNKKPNSLDDFISIILFGENHGYRMKSYGPISLMKIQGKTLIQTQIEAIKATFKHFEIILCSGFETEKTVEFVRNNFPDVNIRIVENQVYFNSNCCESARLCLHNTNNDKILMCNGSLLITPSILASIDYDKSTVLCQQDDKHKNFEVGIIENGGILESMSVGIKGRFWNEIFYLSNKKIINSFYSIVSNPDYKNRFLFEAINSVLKSNRIIVHEMKDDIAIKIHNIKTLKRIIKI